VQRTRDTEEARTGQLLCEAKAERSRLEQQRAALIERLSSACTAAACLKREAALLQVLGHDTDSDADPPPGVSSFSDHLLASCAASGRRRHEAKHLP
jgi:hypothetical protein